jgi:ATP-dependent DNA helicase RecQ
MILRSYGGVFSEPASISEAELGQRLSVSAETVAQLLTRLHQLDILTYVPRTDKPQITFSSELIKAEDLRISPQYYLERKQEAVERLGAVIDYATTMNRCRSQLLIAYFGQSDSRRCGICDVCLERNKANLSELEFNNILEVIKPMLKEAPCSLKELTDACSRISEEKVINAVTWLTDNDKIDVLSDGFFRWSSGNEEH